MSSFFSKSAQVAPAPPLTEEEQYDAIPIEYRIKAIDEYRKNGGTFHTGVGEDGEPEEWADIRDILPIAQRLYDESKAAKKGGRRTRRHRRHRRRHRTSRR